MAAPEPLHVRIGRLREEARAESANAPTSGREQVGVEDAAIRVAAATAGTKDAERRTIFRDLRPGATVTSKGVAKTTLTREEKIDRVKSWASSLTEEQRTEYMIGEAYASRSENAQDLIAEAFSQVEEQALEDSLGIENIDYDAPTLDVDEIVGEEDDDEDEVVDYSDFEATFEQAAWESEQS